MSIAPFVLMALLASAPPPPPAVAPAGQRVLLLPPSASAVDDARLLAAALAARLRQSRSLLLVPEDRFASLSEGPKDGGDELRLEIDAALKRVQSAYRRMAIDEAARTLQATENARINVLACPENIELASQLSLWLGVVQSASHEPKRASERFATALFVDPGRALDPAWFPPQVVSAFQKVRAGLAAAPTGSLSISTDPDGAQVFLDGRSAGSGAVTVNAAEGEHFVCVRRLGYKDWAARLRVVAGRVETQRIFLQQAEPKLLASQLVALLAGSKSIDLDNPAHIEAVGAAVGADVVAAPTAPAGLDFRLVREPAVSRHLTAAMGKATPSQLANDLVGQLEATFAPAVLVVPPPPVVPDVPATPEPWRLELVATGAYLASWGTGGGTGVAMGLQFPVARSLGIGLRVGGAGQFATVPFADSSRDTPPLAQTVGGWEIPASADLRWTPNAGRSWRMLLALGLEGRYASLGSPEIIVREAAAANPVTIELKSTARPTAILVGPQIAVGAVARLSDRLELIVSGRYALEMPVSEPTIQAVIRSNTGATVGEPSVTPGGPRHLLAVDLALAFRL